MSRDIAIAGYDNEAFRGIVRESGSGWVTPMKQPRALAAQIATLASDRGALGGAARRGRAFALENALEPTFARRTDHLVALSRLPAEVRREYAESRPSPAGGAA